MKIYIVAFGFLSLCLNSCSKWLDLKPETLPTEEQILSSSDGYRAVLNGLYRSMGSASLYGKDLTFGIVDCISQQYKLDLGSQVTNMPKYIAAGKFEYQNTALNPAIDNIWLNGFNVIANANNLIQNVKDRDADVFKEGAMERDLILGEAYAVRALMHFDLLRLFAPAPINDDGANYVPYVDNYPNTVPSPIAVQPFLAKVVEDLKLARTLVEAWDTSLAGSGTLVTGEARFYNTFLSGTEIFNAARYEDFFKGRGYRMHYFAITALLARVENYLGNHKNAFDYAEEVMKFEVRVNTTMRNAFTLDTYSGVTSANWDAKNDLKTVSNLIFAIHNARAFSELSLNDHFKRQFAAPAPTWFVINKDAQRIFETRDGVDESSRDYRSLYLIYLANGLHPISGKYFLSTTESVRDRNAMIIPVIRSTEMRYIMAEYYARNNNFAEARQLLANIRSNRGLTETLNIGNWDDFQEELIRDARREYISEGQLLYLYKRLDAPINFGQNIFRRLTRAEYLLPIPSIQI